MSSKVTPSIPGAPSFFLASAYATRSVSILQTCTYSPQNRQDVSAFALTYILRRRSCKSPDAFISSSLPSLWSETLQTAGPLCSTVVTPSPTATLSPSVDFPVEPVIRPTLLRRFLGGTRRVSPVAQHVLVPVLSHSTPPR